MDAGIPEAQTREPQSPNSRLGAGINDRGWNYNVHVLFPHMKHRREDFIALTKNQQKTWIDHVIRAALKDTVDISVFNRHPYNYADALAKSHSREQAQPFEFD